MIVAASPLIPFFSWVEISFANGFTISLTKNDVGEGSNTAKIIEFRTNTKKAKI